MDKSTGVTSDRRLPSTARGRRTRAAIIDAAASLMYTQGVRATTLDDVLAASGAGKSQLYHYFADKADLVSAVIDRQIELVLGAQPSIDQIDSWTGIDAWAAQILALHSAPGGPFACPLGSLAAELRTDETHRPRLDAAFRQWEGRLAKGLRKIQRRGQLAPRADTDRLAAAVIAALQGGLLLAPIRGDLSPLRDALTNAIAQLRLHQR